MNNRGVVIFADDVPMPGVEQPGPHERYRNPQLRVVERSLAELEPGFVRLQPHYAGVCGSDAHLASCDPTTRYVRSSAPASIPPEGRLLGHECCGRVLEVNDHGDLRPGDLVTLESIVVCFRCEPCRRGDFNQCDRAQLVGLQTDGVFANVVDVPASLVHRLGPDFESETGMRAAACFEPAGVAFVACQVAALRPGDRLLVTGAGPIGVLAAMLGRLVFGAAHVRVIEPIERRRSLAARWADDVFGADEAMSDGLKFDVVIEASGYLDSLSSTLSSVAGNGRIVMLGRSGAGLSLPSVDSLISGQISISGARGHLGGVFDRLIRLVAAGRLPLEEIVTGEIEGPEALCAALEDPERLARDHCKLLVRMNPES